jgi:lipopolysaccharide export LptBFGC system permease protein LptF
MKTAGLVVAGTFSFFIITNFAVWAMGGLYPMTLEGLMACYIAGIPFYGNTLLSTALFSAVFFGLTKWVNQNNLLAADR